MSSEQVDEKNWKTGSWNSCQTEQFRTASKRKSWAGKYIRTRARSFSQQTVEEDG